MLRLRAEANREDVPSVHHSFDPITAHTLYRMGKELPDPVSASYVIRKHGTDRVAVPVCSQLFGEEEDGGELDEAEKQGENGTDRICLRHVFLPSDSPTFVCRTAYSEGDCCPSQGGTSIQGSACGSALAARRRCFFVRSERSEDGLQQGMLPPPLSS